jgi:hypothetical protein
MAWPFLMALKRISMRIFFMTGFEWGTSFTLECLAIFFKGCCGFALILGVLLCLGYIAIWGESIRDQAAERKRKNV